MNEVTGTTGVPLGLPYTPRHTGYSASLLDQFYALPTKFLQPGKEPLCEIHIFFFSLLSAFLFVSLGLPSPRLTAFSLWLFTGLAFAMRPHSDCIL